MCSNLGAAAANFKRRTISKRGRVETFRVPDPGRPDKTDRDRILGAREKRFSRTKEGSERKKKELTRCVHEAPGTGDRGSNRSIRTVIIHTVDRNRYAFGPDRERAVGRVYSPDESIIMKYMGDGGGGVRSLEAARGLMKPPRTRPESDRFRENARRVHSD